MTEEKEEKNIEEGAAEEAAAEEAVPVAEEPVEEESDGEEEPVEEEPAAAEEPEAEEPVAAEVAAEEAAEISAEAPAEEKPAAKKAAPKKAAAKKAARPKAKKKKAQRAKVEVKVPAVKELDEKAAGLNPEVFDIEASVGVLHEVVRAEQAALRSGNASTKTRGEVRGGGAKPWRQKGTGRARAGSSRMPHWTGGGVTFGPRPRDYDFKVNRKVKSKALKMALSARVSEGGFKVVESLPFEEPKTAAAAAVLGGMEIGYPLLVVLTDEDANAALAFRNIPRVAVCAAAELKVIDVLAARTVLATREVVEQLNSRLGESK